MASSSAPVRTLAVAIQPDLRGDGAGSEWVVAGDHDGADAGAAAGGDRLPALPARGGSAKPTRPTKVRLDSASAWVAARGRERLLGQGNHAQAAGRHRRDLLEH